VELRDKYLHPVGENATSMWSCDKCDS